MLRLFQTFFGVLFFGLCFFMVIIKNSPLQYKLELSYPLEVNHKSYFNLLLEKFPKGVFSEINSSSFVRNLPTFSSHLDMEQSTLDIEEDLGKVIIKTPLGNGYLIEQWYVNPSKQNIELHFSYNLDFLSQNYLFFRPNENKGLIFFATEQMEKLSEITQQALNSHRWSFTGIQTKTMDYYLWIEGDASWKSLEEETKKGYQILNNYIKNENIRPSDAPFIIFPLMGRNNLRWRVCLPVDRYILSNNDSIGCRKFRLFKNISLRHYGTDRHLEKSWKTLRDSLRKLELKQSYPAWQEIKDSYWNTQDPLLRESILHIPIY